MENKDERMSILSAVIFVCRKCKAGLEWGQHECPKCKAVVVCGLPLWIDFSIGLPIGIVFHILKSVITLILSFGTCIALSNEWYIPIYPRRARLNLILNDSLINLYGTAELPFYFEAKVNEWKDTNPDSIAAVYAFLKHMEPSDAARLMAYLPLDVSEPHLIRLSNYKSLIVREEAIRSMSRLKGEKFIVRLREMANKEKDFDVKKAAQEELLKLEPQKTMVQA